MRIDDIPLFNHFIVIGLDAAKILLKDVDIVHLSFNHNIVSSLLSNFSMKVNLCLGG